MNYAFTKIIALLMFFIVGCGSKKNTDYPRNETLLVGGFQWGAPVSFNPLSDWPVSWPVTGNVNLVYEPLFAFNILTGELEPLIGQRYDLEDSVLTVSIQKDAHWSDGKPLTADDVLYTLYLHKRYQTLHHSIWRFIDTVRVNSSENSLSFRLDSKNFNPLTIKDMLGAVAILPKHVFQPLEESAKKRHNSLKKDHAAFQAKVLEDMLSNKFLDKSVGSGPYTLLEYDDKRIVLQRDEKYWGNASLYGGKLPAPKYVIHPIFATNEEYNRALEEGRLDISATYCPMVWNMKKNGVGTWESSEPYYIPGSIPSIVIQQMPSQDTSILIGSDTLTTTKAPLKSAFFRRIMASAIDYEMVRKRSIQGYAPPLSPGFIINSGIEQVYYNDSTAKEFGIFTDSTYNDLKTRQNNLKKLLADSGYSWIEDPANPAGRLKLRDGRVLADMKISSPKGWSDWEIAVQIVSASLKNIGIPVNADIVAEDLYWANLGLGKFDLILKTPQSEQLPSLPWSRFERIMSSADIDTVGVFIYTNEGRYINPTADSLLSVIPRLKTDEEIEQGYFKLNELFMKEMPVIPLMYRPSMFYQFSTKTWDNFPTLDNAYAPPSCLIVAAGRKALWDLTSTSPK